MNTDPLPPNLTTYLGESRLLTVGREALVSVIRPNTYRQARMLVAVTRCGYYTDYPLLTASGAVTWDFPERFSKRFRERAGRLIRKRAAKQA